VIKKLIPVLLGLVLAGGGFFAYNTFFAGGPPPDPPAVAQTKAAELAVTDKKTRLKDLIDGPIVSLGDPFIVNLSDPGLASFVKTDVSIKVDVGTPLTVGESATAAPKLEELAELRNIVIDVLNTHSAAELTTPDGREVAKKEIIKAINAPKSTTSKTVALEVFFINFAVQSIPGA
jgi:flagellar FliL protein